jgi:hypothetical protein
VILAAGALMLAACGDNNASKESSSSPERPAGQANAQQAPQPESPPSQSSGGAKVNPDRSSSTKKHATANNRQQGSSTAGQQATGGDTSGANGGQGDKRSRPLTQKEKIERHIKKPATSRDIYRQGKAFCSSFGLNEIRKEWHIMSKDPREVATQYANIYEQQYPRLRLPYMQGCVAGFKARERRDARKRKASE